MSSARSNQLVQVRSAQPSQVISAGFDYLRPPTLEGHNFFVQTSFKVLLDSMESPLSQESIRVPVEDSK